jgi:hypothetical protein
MNINPNKVCRIIKDTFVNNLFFVGAKLSLLFINTCKFVTQALTRHKRNNITTSIYHSRTRTEFPFLRGDIILLTYLRSGLHFSEG